jgi:Zn finger protein HypA/HybF involved in hydrogenase expression
MPAQMATVEQHAREARAQLRRSVADAVREIVERSRGRPVERVVLALGPYAERWHVERYWCELSEGTSAGEATLTCEQVLDGLICADCRDPYFGTCLDLCPRCGGEGLLVAPAPDVAVVALSCVLPRTSLPAATPTSSRCRPS